MTLNISLRELVALLMNFRLFENSEIYQSKRKLSRICDFKVLNR